MAEQDATPQDHSIADWLRIYERAADIISDFLAEGGQRPQIADHDARAILSRLAKAGITVERLEDGEVR